MAIALVTHISAQGSAGLTTASVTTTGATLLVIGVSNFGAVPTTTPVSDSKSNTWRTLTPQNSGSGSDGNICIFYAYDKAGAALSVGTLHKFSTSASFNFDDILVAAFSATLSTSSVFDVENGASSASTPGSTFQPGSITPSLDTELIVTLCGGNSLTWTGISDWMTISDSINYGTNEGSALAYLVQTTAAAINPSWTLASSGLKIGCAAASFKPSTTASAPTGKKFLSPQAVKRASIF